MQSCTMAAENVKQHFLIVNADDYGYSVERDDGILECYRRGAITNVSVLMNGVSVESAIEKALSVGMPMGMHMNLTEGTPVSKVPHKTLVGEDGFLLGRQGFLEAVKRGRVDMDEVRREIQSQIDRYTELTGHKPDSIDGHQHKHLLPGVCEVFASVLQENGITLTRLSTEGGMDEHTFHWNRLLPFMKKVVQMSQDATPIFKQHGIWAPRFIGLKTMGQDMTINNLKTYITDSFERPLMETYTKDGTIVCELMVHPGNRTGDVGGCGNGPDDFSQSEDREHEMRTILSEDMMSFYKDMNIKLISFKDCKTMC